MRFGFDVDEVICDVINPLLNKINTEFSSEYTIEIFEDYDFYKNVYTGNKDVDKLIADRFIEIIREGKILYGNSLPILDMVSTIKTLKKAKHEVHFITARSLEFEELTKNWLLKNGLVFDSLNLVGNWKCKGDAIRGLKLDYFVDDHIDNIEMAICVDKNLRGRTFLMDKPWNRWYNNPDVVRIKSAKCFIDNLNLGDINDN